MWRTGANELHEATEDDETLDVSEIVVCIYLHVYSLFKDLLQDLKLKKGEFTLSKDTTVSLWTEYRTWFGGIQLQEVSGGVFVIVSNDLHDEI